MRKRKKKSFLKMIRSFVSLILKIIRFPLKFEEINLSIPDSPENLGNFSLVQDIIYTQNDIGLPFGFGINREPLCKTESTENKIKNTTIYGIYGLLNSQLISSDGNFIKNCDDGIFIIPGGYLVENTDFTKKHRL